MEVRIQTTKGWMRDLHFYLHTGDIINEIMLI